MTTDTKLVIEDTFADIVGKSQKGLKLSTEELAERAGVTPDAVQNVKAGNPDLDTLEKLAFVLNLHAPSLLALAQDAWYPRDVGDLPGLAMFTTWYGDMTVNAYLVYDPETREATSYDTGSSCQPMLDYMNEHGLVLKKAFITHTHMDHLADLEKLLATTHAEGYGSLVENPLGLKPLAHGDGLVLGKLRIRVLGTSGHTPGGLSYYITGLSRPIVVVGDALFAGSQGGAPHAYEEALRNNRERTLTLPENTVICPGHGPQTSVGEERRHNPFFPELKS